MEQRYSLPTNTHVTYGPGKISCTICQIHTFMHCFQKALAYFVTSVNYARKMLMKLTSWDNV